MTRLSLGRFGITTGDVAIVLAVVAVLAALSAPSRRTRDFREHTARVLGEVEALRLAAEGHYDRTGSWPTPAGTGRMPSELVGSFAEGHTLAGASHALEWTRWEVVDLVEAPPYLGPAPLDAPPDTAGPALVPEVRRIGGVVLHAGDERVLAELLAHYGRDASFVRDTTWTLVLPRRARGG